MAPMRTRFLEVEALHERVELPISLRNKAAFVLKGFDRFLRELGLGSSLLLGRLSEHVTDHAAGQASSAKAPDESFSPRYHSCQEESRKTAGIQSGIHPALFVGPMLKTPFSPERPTVVLQVARTRLAARSLGGEPARELVTRGRATLFCAHE